MTALVSAKRFTFSVVMVAFHCLAVSAQSYSDYSAPDLPGRLYVPPDADAAANPRPLILALHGGGGIGSDNTSHLVDFSDLLQEAAQRQAFLYVPQATSAFWHPAARAEAVMAMVDRAVTERNIDPDRLYITGFSMGGGGAWDYLNLYPGRFAAAIPIAGISPRAGSDFANLVGTPIWAFHARDDTVVSFRNSRNVIDRILEAAAHPPPDYPTGSELASDFEYENPSLHLRYTEWPNGNHAIWWRVYSSAATYDWLFAQSLARVEADVRIINVRLLPSAQALAFEVATDPIVDVVIERSTTLNEWFPDSTLINVSGTVPFQTTDIDAFFRAAEARRSSRK